MIRAKKLNHQRGVAIQIASQISEHCSALASATAELTPRRLKVESEVTVYTRHKASGVSVNTKRNIIKDIKHHLYIKMPQIWAPGGERRQSSETLKCQEVKTAVM